VDGERPISNRVDTSVNHEELTALDPGVNGSLADSALEQLSPRHKAMLILGQPRDHLIDSVLHVTLHPSRPPANLTSDAFVLPQRTNASLVKALRRWCPASAHR
jgi:hypothetical protein